MYETQDFVNGFGITDAETRPVRTLAETALNFAERSAEWPRPGKINGRTVDVTAGKVNPKKNSGAVVRMQEPLHTILE